MANDPQKPSTTCTWCRGRGYIRESSKLAGINSLLFSVVVLAVGVIFIFIGIRFLDSLGVFGFILMGLGLLLATVPELGLILAGAKKIPCPHCFTPAN